jgi:hypothetical protein
MLMMMSTTTLQSLNLKFILCTKKQKITNYIVVYLQTPRARVGPGWLLEQRPRRSAEETRDKTKGVAPRFIPLAKEGSQANPYRVFG